MSYVLFDIHVIPPVWEDGFWWLFRAYLQHELLLDRTRNVDTGASVNPLFLPERVNYMIIDRQWWITTNIFFSFFMYCKIIFPDVFVLGEYFSINNIFTFSPSSVVYIIDFFCTFVKLIGRSRSDATSLTRSLAKCICFWFSQFFKLKAIIQLG